VLVLDQGVNMRLDFNLLTTVIRARMRRDHLCCVEEAH